MKPSLRIVKNLERCLALPVDHPAFEDGQICEQFLQELTRLQIQLKEFLLELRLEPERSMLLGSFYQHLLSTHNHISLRLQQSLSDSARSLHEQLWQQLDELLHFFYELYHQELDLELRIPQYYQQRASDKRQDRLDRLRSSLMKKNYQSALIDLVIAQVDECWLNTTNTFKQVLFLKEVLTHLESLPRHERPITEFNDLERCILKYNFNTSLFQCFFQNRIQQMLDSALLPESLGIKSLIKQIKQLPRLKKQPRLDPCLESMRKFLLRYCQQEMAALESNSSFSQEPLKVRLLASADEVALLFKAAVDAKIIECISLQYLFKVLSPHLASQRQSSLSAGSLRSKTYELNEISVKRVRTMLEKTIHSLENAYQEQLRHLH